MHCMGIKAAQKRSREHLCMWIKCTWGCSSNATWGLYCLRSPCREAHVFRGRVSLFVKPVVVKSSPGLPQIEFLPRFVCELVEAPRLCIHDKCSITWEGRNSGHDPQSPVLFFWNFPWRKFHGGTRRDALHRPKIAKANIMLVGWREEGFRDISRQFDD